ncbi:glycoside hydrolase family 131 protein [Cenococcum geophilum 1.58]|uniref:glycoside hydrolase family 131 protein n=1 Tax=Cenococcum geophilum 1.58 TaxID=794803 RepID=UPI000DC8ADA3|nr:glycoside hydrolase family 131 protein [Cenococcum geophilum 1.58]
MISYAALLVLLLTQHVLVWELDRETGIVLCDGRFNEFTTSTNLNDWSWSNQRSGTEYVNLVTSYKNPADTASKQGVKVAIDSTSKWDSDMWRMELIPQMTAAINEGHVYYHFSIKRSSTNVPSATNEHQICFLEIVSHFTELKYDGESGTLDTNLQWMVGNTSKWTTTFEADDFSGGTVTFWHSTGYGPLTKTADWHLGVLRLSRKGYGGTAED